MTGHVTRRSFLAGLATGSLVLGTRLTGAGGVLRVADERALEFAPDVFVAIAPDGQVTIVTHRSEMGTGIRTALPTVVADELGADWARVTIDQAIGDAKYGSQNTDGSRSVRRFYQRMRVAGATARTMLERAAAATWNVDPAEVTTRDHQCWHDASKRSAPFADLVADAAKLDVPAAEELRFRSTSEWKYVGKDVPLTDLDGLLTGRATFGIDARREGQLFAVVARSPVLGGRVKSFDADAAKAVRGVVDVVEIPASAPPYVFHALGGVAVLAENTWAAIEGRKALAVEWDDGSNASFSSDDFERALVESSHAPGTVHRKAGDVAAPLEAADEATRFDADYYVPLQPHAAMEPPCALAEVTFDNGGKVTRCEAWAPTQNPQAAQGEVAAALGLEPQNVVIHVTLLGGGFGRKSKPDYVAEAALLARATRRPVLVTWTREDDLRHDYYHAVANVHVEAAVDERGMPSACLLRSAFPTISSTFNPAAREGSAMELGMGLTDIPYAIPNLQVESAPADAHVRIGWLRSVANIYHAFATGSFPDELARRADRDPLEYLLELLGEPRILSLEGTQYPNYGASIDDYPIDIGRLRHVTERVAELADWGRELPRGRGLGIACHRSFASYCANVVEVEVTKRGQVRIPRVHVVIDAGMVIHPDRVVAQMEGAAVFGAGLALTGEITATDGRIDQSNFHDFLLARSTQAPREVQVEIVSSEQPPGGVGEVGVPPLAPALCNAIHAATGVRVRRLPLSGHDLSWS